MRCGVDTNTYLNTLPPQESTPPPPCLSDPRGEHIIPRVVGSGAANTRTPRPMCELYLYRPRVHRYRRVLVAPSDVPRLLPPSSHRWPLLHTGLTPEGYDMVGWLAAVRLRFSSVSTAPPFSSLRVRRLSCAHQGWLSAVQNSTPCIDTYLLFQP